MHAFCRDNLLFCPVDVTAMHLPMSFDDFHAHYQDAGSGYDLLDLARARIVFASGDSDLETPFELARRNLLKQTNNNGAGESLISGLRRTPLRDAAAPGLDSIRTMEGGMLDVGCAASFLQFKYVGEAPEIPCVGTASVFTVAGARGIIPKESAGRLADATGLWHDLDTAVGVVTEEDFDVETVPANAMALISEVAGDENHGALIRRIRAAATRSATAIDQVYGMDSQIQ